MRPINVSETLSVSPFLRWAGGKRWLIQKLNEMVGSLSYRSYFEPFLGGGSIFFGLNPSGHSYLSDLNADLINAYAQIRKDHVAVYRALAKHRNTSDYYYKLRSLDFDDPIDSAAQFIFLNHTSFNGLYRVNLAGKYNVPYGHRETPKIPSEDHLGFVAKRLANATLFDSDFETLLRSAGKGDLVFLDPPYTVAHSNNGFVKYNQRLFAFEDQQRLAVAIDQLRRQGTYFVMTNAYHESIEQLFERGDRRFVMSRANAIGGKSALRGSASEFLFTNVPDCPWP